MKRAYFFVNELDDDGREELIRFFDLLKSPSYEAIYAKHFKLGTDQIKDDTMFWYGSNLEVFLFARYLYERGVREFHVLYRPELFIYNERLYVIDNNSVEEIDLENAGFFTLRSEFNHPFYEILDYLIQKK